MWNPCFVLYCCDIRLLIELRLSFNLHSRKLHAFVNIPLPAHASKYRTALPRLTSGVIRTRKTLQSSSSQEMRGSRKLAGGYADCLPGWAVPRYNHRAGSRSCGKRHEQSAVNMEAEPPRFSTAHESHTCLKMSWAKKSHCL